MGHLTTKTFWASAIVALCIALAAWLLRNSTAPETPEPTSVQVRLGPIVQQLDLSGSLRPSTVLELTAPFDGTVQARDFVWGEALTQGALLLRLSTEDIDRELRQAESSVRKAQAAALPLRHWDASVDVQRALRAVANARLSVAEGERKLADTRRLLDLGVIARSEFDDLRSQQQLGLEQLASAQDELASTRSRGDALAQQSAALELDNARSQLAQLQRERRQHTLHMRLDGTVSPGAQSAMRAGGAAASLEVGARVKRGEVLLRMQSSRTLELLALADEADATRVQKGQATAIRLAVLPDVRLQGTVVGVNAVPAGTESERSGEAVRYEVRIALASVHPAQAALLRQGLSAQASVEVYRREAALLLPVPAVQTDSQGHFVMLPNSTGQPTRQSVQVGVVTAQDIEVLGDLRAGMTVLMPLASGPHSP